MNRETAYVTSIPEDATETVTQRWSDKSRKRAEYYVKKELVGIRMFDRTGELEIETSWRNGKQHGWEYHWYSPGELISAEPYEDGVPHGTAYQWGRDGRLIGTYTMEHGTGIDLWRDEWRSDSITLAEVHYMRDGLWHGFEWWLHADQVCVWRERHWHAGQLHGIERDWNAKGRLHRGYPKYWIQGEQVTKAKYLRASAKDPTLPPFRPEDNRPQRTFPPEIAAHLGVYREEL